MKPVFFAILLSLTATANADLNVPYSQDVQPIYPFYPHYQQQRTVPLMPRPQPDFEELQRKQQQFERQMYQQYRYDLQKDRYSQQMRLQGGVK